MPPFCSKWYQKLKLLLSAQVNKPFIINQGLRALVPSNLHLRSTMWFFTRESTTAHLGERKFATLYLQQSSNMSRILKLVPYYMLWLDLNHVRAGTVKFPKSRLWNLPHRQRIHHLSFSQRWGSHLKYLPLIGIPSNSLHANVFSFIHNNAVVLSQLKMCSQQKWNLE